jgi:S1-C subfamily serine protease
MVKHQEVLGASEFEPYELPEDEKLGLFEALKRIIGIVWDRIRRRPYELVVAKVHGVHDWMATKVEAIDGGATGLKVRRAGEKARDGGQTVELEEVLERPLFVPEGPVANTWSDLRGLAFCLVDGRGLPADLGEGLVERGAKRALVTEPLLIAPDPQIGYSLVRGDREAPACDPLNEDPSMKPDEPKPEPKVEATSESSTSTDAAGEPGGEAPAEAASPAEPAVPAETRSAAESKFERQPAPDVADQASPVPESASKSHIVGDIPGADASELLDESTDAEDRDGSDSSTENNRAGQERPWLTPESAVIDLDQGLEEDPDTVRARSSLLWQVGLRLARNLKKAQAQAESLRAAEDLKLDPESKEAKELAEAEKAESMKRSRARIRGLIKTAAITFGLSILVVLLAWDLPWLVTTPVWDLPLPVRVPVLLLIPVIWLLAMAYQARKLLIRERRESREIAQREIDELNQKMLASIREGDAVRLGRRYNEFMDWAEIVGWYVHRPWIGEPLEQLDIDASIPRGTRPVAFQMAIGESDSDWLAELGAITRSHVFKPGWLNDLYSINQDEVLKTAAGPSRFVSGATSEVSSDPAGDVSDDLESPRRNLLRGVRRGDYRHVGDNAMTIDLLNRLDGLPLDSAATKVELVSSEHGGTEPLPLSPTWFSAPANLESLIRRLTPSVIRLTATVGGRHAVGTGVLLEGEELVATAFHVIEGSTSIAAQLPNGDLVDATVESLSPESDLAILRLASRVPMLGAVLAADGKLDQGTPVVTLGFQVAKEGEPTFSWGLVTATGRKISFDDVGEGVETIEANYQSAAGASGSPVFNLEGEVVGLHAGSSQPQGAGPSHVSHAVPAGLVRTLVEDGSTRGVPRWNANASASAAAQGPARRRQATGTSPSEFFNDLFGSADKQAFLPGHWVLAGSSGHNAVDQVVASPQIVDVSTSQISDYCEGNEFLRPLRLMVHRMDMSTPVAPDTLSSCSDEG